MDKFVYVHVKIYIDIDRFTQVYVHTLITHMLK